MNKSSIIYLNESRTIDFDAISVAHDAFGKYSANIQKRLPNTKINKPVNITCAYRIYCLTYQQIKNIDNSDEINT